MDQGKEAQFDYERLVGVIRDELDRSLKPVTEGLARVEAAVDRTYSREVMDEKLRQRDSTISDLRADLEEMRKVVGSFWTNTLIRASAVLGLIGLMLELWKGLPR